MTTYTENQLDILNLIPDGAFVIDNNYTLLFWNKQLEEWTNYTSQDILGKKINSLFPFLNHNKYLKRLHNIFEGGAPVIFSSQLHHNIIPSELSNGQSRIQNTYVRPIKLQDDNKFYALFIIQDVTEYALLAENYKSMRNKALDEVKERKEVEDIMIRTTKLLEEERSMFISGPVVVFKWKNSEGWPVEYVSPNVKYLLGYSTNDLLSGKVPYGSLIPSEDIDHVTQEVTINSENQVSSFEHKPYRLIRADQSVVWVSDHTTIIRDPSGEITHYLGYLIDITERIKMEMKQQEVEKQIKIIISNFPVVLWSVDKDGIFTLSEGKGLIALGLEPGQVVGQSSFDIYKDFPEIVNAIKNTLSGQYLHGTVEVGEIIFETWYTPLLDKNNNIVGMMGVSMDVTERINAERELKSKVSELETFNKLAVGRELRMIELKKEVNHLLNQLGETSKYEIVSE